MFRWLNFFFFFLSIAVQPVHIHFPTYHISASFYFVQFISIFNPLVLVGKFSAKPSERNTLQQLPFLTPSHTTPTIVRKKRQKKAVGCKELSCKRQCNFFSCNMSFTFVLPTHTVDFLSSRQNTTNIGILMMSF